MPDENTDLERRVLAHERILETLIFVLSRESPGLIEKLMNSFGAPGLNRGHQHDHTTTSEHAEQFVRHIDSHLRERGLQTSNNAASGGESGQAAAEPKEDLAEVDEAAKAIVFRTALRHGIWRVTRDDVFHGDYTAVGPAVASSRDAAKAVERNGGTARMIFDGPPALNSSPAPGGQRKRNVR